MPYPRKRIGGVVHEQSPCEVCKLPVWFGLYQRPKVCNDCAGRGPIRHQYGNPHPSKPHSQRQYDGS